MVNPLTFAARSLLAGVFIGGGLNQLKAPDALAPLVDGAKQKYHVDLPVGGKELVTLNGAGMVAAGAAMALGIAPRTSALALAGMLVPTTVVGHNFWDETDQHKKFEQTNAFFSNAAILGGLMMVALNRKK